MAVIDTIAAVATAKGRSGIGIVKVSGELAGAIGEALTGVTLEPRYAQYLPFTNVEGDTLDQGIALFFKAPDSYTGEDVLELHAHGNPFVLDQLLRTIATLGARDARPGEFTERAFLNNKLDLAQAEAVADLIESNSDAAARAALKSLQGEFSTRVNAILQQLINTRVYVEAALDFAEEEIDFLQDNELSFRLSDLRNSIAKLLETAAQGCLIREGLTVVIAGKPNVGKSSLLNRLTGEDTAIVTDVAGTTRDVLREEIVIDGLPVHIVDTAGLRASGDPIEQEGVRRARLQIDKADLILAVQIAGQDTDPSLLAGLPEDIPVLSIFNKSDLIDEAVVDSHTQLTVSAKSGAGIDVLRTRLKDHAGYTHNPEGIFMARRRHLNALNQVQQHTVRAGDNLNLSGAGELAAEELRLAQLQLSSITGEFGSDDLLGEIFGRFCIGK